MEYIAKPKVYIKTKNNTKILNLRYLYTLIFFALFTLISTYIFNRDLFIPLIKSISITIVISYLLSLIINIFYKHSYLFNQILQVAIIIGLLGVNTNTYILIISISIATIINIFTKNNKLSSSLYGLLIINIYNLFTNNYLLNANNISVNNFIFGDTTYLSPLLSIIIFIYLFNKKNIKYNIYIAYLLTVFSIILLSSIFNGIGYKEIYLMIVNNSLLFLSIYPLCDFMSSPTLSEGQVIYGIILGIITSVLIYIIPELAVVIPMIIGSLCLNKPIEVFSYKLKYNYKLYIFIISLCIFICLLSIVLLYIIK